jgi:hypothetical protein
MGTPRSPSFYTNFFRAVRSCQPTTYQSIRSPPTSSPRAKPCNVGQRSQSTYPNRYGPAATEGLPPPPKPLELLNPKQAESKPKEPVQEESKPKPPEPTKSDEEAAKKEEEKKASSLSDSKPEYDPEQSQALPTKELDMVLSVPSLSEIKDTRSRHPHLEPSPYEHHFDTFTLVQQLSGDPDTFTAEQAITLMKAVRLQLALNLDIAKESLVSKSDIENESYLFRAACSELHTTLQGARFAENQRQRTSRAQLQHEHDLLYQKVNQDVLAMREDLKAMFNDRKMGLQEEKRKIDSKISELNYEITVLLNSEAKSEVEGLRWVLTRRAAMAIGTAACRFPLSLIYLNLEGQHY